MIRPSRTTVSPRLVMVAAGLVAGGIASAALWAGYRECVRLCYCVPSTGGVDGVEKGAWIDELGLRRYRPSQCELDANGFRNAEVPGVVDAVAMGDSNTWGASVSRIETWPLVLQKRIGRPVYNMAMPGWGPIDFLAAIPHALKLHPRRVLVELYLGNDIYDAYARVASPPPAMEETLRPFSLSEELRDDWIGPAALNEASVAHLDDPFWGVGRFAALAKSDPNRLQILRRGDAEITLSPRYRLLGVNLDEPRIATGLRLATEALVRMAWELRKHGVELLVVILPSKEYVYCPLFEEARAVPAWESICRHEARMEKELMTALNAASIPVSSSLPELREEAAAGHEVWPGTDTHPGPAGTALFAKAVEKALDDHSR